MAAQEDVKRERPATQVTGKAPETAEAPVASEISLKDLELSTYVRNRLINAGLETVQDLVDRLEQGRKIEGIADGSLEEIHTQLTKMGLQEFEGEEAGVEQDRQTLGEMEQSTDEAERVPAEAKLTLEAEPENTEPPPEAPGEKAEEQPISFNVRVTVDEQGKPLRTEIQPVTRDKEAGKYLGLNGKELVAYMERYINTTVTPEPMTPPAPPPTRAEAPTPGPLGPAISLIVSDVQVFRAGAPGVAALVFEPDEAFVVQACFRLGPEALSLTAQESAFQVRVLAKELTSGTSTLLATLKGKLTRDVLEYPVTMRAPGLPPGLYRLLTLVTLQAPINMLGHYEGPLVRIAEVQSSVNPAVPLEAPVSL